MGNGLMKVTFLKNREETEKALLAFANASIVGKFLKRFAFPVASLIIFLIMLAQNGPYEGKDVLIDGKPDHFLSVLFYLYVPILFGLFFGWLISAFLKTVAKNYVLRQVNRIPPESFGSTTITLDDNGIKVEAPLYELKYDWKFVDSYFIASDFLFICRRSEPVIWFPTSALAPQPDEFILSLNKRIPENGKKNQRKVRAA